MTSCAKYQSRGPDQPAWGEIASAQPDLLLMLGDNVYGRSREWDIDFLAARYEDQFTKVRALRHLMQSTQVVATWDDHDFGPNNSSGETLAGRKHRDAARALFLRYMSPRVSEPAALQRVEREIYCSYVQDGVLFIVLDGRYYRRPAPGAKGAQAQSAGSAEDYLGADQALWLWDQLARACYGDIRATVICSGTTIGIPGSAGMEKRNGERIRHYPGFFEDLNKRFSVCPTPIFLSGNIHKNRFVDHGGFVEITSSGVARVTKKGKLRDNWALIDFEDNRISVDLIGRNKSRNYTLRYSDARRGAGACGAL